jgi:hypothetical protein
LFDHEEYLKDEKDWVEFDEVKQSLDIKQENSNYKSPTLIIEKIEKWYENRINEIELLSGFVDNAEKLCQLAIRNGCRKKLTKLYDNLLTLSTLIYECKTDNKLITLSYIKNLNELEQMKLIMSNYDGDLNNDLYQKRLQDWLLPYIERRTGDSEREKLIREYLLLKSKDELETCLKIIQLKLKLIQQQQTKLQEQKEQKEKTKKSFVSDTTIDINLAVLNNLNLVSICCSCLYINENNDQLDICKKIVENLKNFSSDAKITEVENHLKCCEIYHKYNVPGVKLINLKESIENEENCRQSINSLASSSFKPKINEEYLNEVEKTFQFLHANLYKNVLSFQSFKEILIRNLLNSNLVENIRLAAKKVDELFQVDVNLAMKLCIESSQLYFNSSTCYHDSDMKLAQECLSIVDSNIKKKTFNKNSFDSNNENNFKNLFNQEHDLIAAVKIINDFNVTNLLPIKIRSMDNRFDIVKLILEKNSSAYKEHEKLVNLGKLLGLNKINKNCEEIILLICEHSITKQNLQIALLMSKNLIKYNYKEAWKCTKELAIQLLNSKMPSTTTTSSTTTNLLASLKRLSTNIYNLNEIELTDNEVYLNEISELLRFSITYCDNESLDEILSLQNGISSKLMIKKQNLDDDDSQSKSPVKLDFSRINRTYSFDFETKNNNKLACLLDDLISFDKKSDEIEVNDGIFLKKLEKLLELDLSLFVSYLLQLNTRNEIYYIELIINNTYLNESLPFESLLYILTLTILGKLNIKFNKEDAVDKNLTKKSNLYFVNILNLIDIVRRLQSVHVNSDDELLKKLFSLFTKVDNLYTENIQLNELNSLNKGINISRFKNENDYKKDTIQGLAMDVSTFELACNLAKLNGLCLWDIYISFIEYLFNDYEGDTKLKLIEEYITKLKPELIKDKAKLVERVTKSIIVDGTQIEKLLLFYSLLAENDDLFEVNLKLLKKMKSINFEFRFDYKELLDQPIRTLNSILNDSTLQFFAKNAANLSSVLTDKSIKLSSSRIYSIYYLKKFHYWLDQTSTINESFQINDQFESLKDYLKKITLESDCKSLIYRVVLDEKTVKKLNVSQRKELLKRFIKLFKKSPDSSKSTVQFSYEEVYGYLVKLQDHLKLLESVNSLLIADEKNYYKFSIDVKLSELINPDDIIEDFSDLEELFISMLFNGYSIEKLNQILLILKQTELTVEKLVKNHFKKLFNFIEESKNKEKNIDELNTFLQILSTYLNKATTSGSLIITQEDVMEFVRSFCDNTKIELEIRLKLLEYIKTLFTTINTTDLLLLIVYKTNAILDTYNLSFRNISVERISSEEERSLLFHSLYSSIKSSEESIGLINLLKIWPPFENIHEINGKLWNLALIQYLNLINKEEENVDLDIISLINELKKDKQLNEYDIAHISNQILIRIKESSKNEKIRIKINNFKLIQCFKLCFLYQNFPLIKQLIDNIDFKIIDEEEKSRLFKNSNLDKLFFIDTKTPETKVNSESIELLIKHLIDTQIYDLFSAYLVKYETKEHIEYVIKILKEKNHLIEASYLISILNNTHSKYNTFGLAYALLQKFK